MELADKDSNTSSNFESNRTDLVKRYLAASKQSMDYSLHCSFSVSENEHIVSNRAWWAVHKALMMHIFAVNCSVSCLMWLTKLSVWSNAALALLMTSPVITVMIIRAVIFKSKTKFHILLA